MSLFCEIYLTAHISRAHNFLPVKTEHNVVWGSLRGSPNDSIHGGGTHQAVCDRHNAVQRLCLHKEPVTGRPKTVPVEYVDGAVAGAANHLPTSLEGMEGDQEGLLSSLELMSNMKSEINSF